jgi:hypothetical protein
MTETTIMAVVLWAAIAIAIGMCLVIYANRGS